MFIAIAVALPVVAWFCTPAASTDHGYQRESENAEKFTTYLVMWASLACAIVLFVIGLKLRTRREKPARDDLVTLGTAMMAMLMGLGSVGALPQIAILMSGQSNENPSGAGLLGFLALWMLGLPIACATAFVFGKLAKYSFSTFLPP